MKHLHVVLLSSTLLFASSVMAKQSDTSVLKDKLKPWQPTEVSLTGDQITIVTPSGVINSDIYTSIIQSGVCTPIWTKGVPANYLEGIKQINVINKFKSIGYSFEKPLEVCKEMGNLMDKPATAVMFGNTHSYISK